MATKLHASSGSHTLPGLSAILPGSSRFVPSETRAAAAVAGPCRDAQQGNEVPWHSPASPVGDAFEGGSGASADGDATEG